MATHPLEGQAKRLSAYTGEDEVYEDRPLYQALVEQARIQGCAGATALRGMVGFGASSREEAKHALRMSTDCPVLVSVIDEPHAHRGARRGLERDDPERAHHDRRRARRGVLRGGGVLHRGVGTAFASRDARISS